MQLVFATHNSHKIEEMQSLLKSYANLKSLTAIGCEEDIPETADTLEGNALLKAHYVYEKYGCDCFADDTGLEVEALDGAPGVYSARYATEGHDSTANMQKLLDNLTGKKNRRAQFRTVIALLFKGEEFIFEGIVKGVIAEEKQGKSGFGYDPIFIPEGFSESFAQMTVEQKNLISHRARAAAQLNTFLSQL